MVDFNKILEETIENVERPAMAPLGAYVFQITKVPEFRDLTSDKGSWDIIEFQGIKAVQPTEEVDAEMFAAWGGKPGNILVRKSFMFDKNDEVASGQTLFQAKEFLTHCGVDLSGSFRQALNSAVNTRFIGVLRYRQGDDGRQFYELGKTAPVA